MGIIDTSNEIVVSLNESPLRVGDKTQSTLQRSIKESAPHYSIVVRIKDSEGKEHLHVGLVPDPASWARKIRYNVDNPSVVEEIEGDK